MNIIDFRDEIMNMEDTVLMRWLEEREKLCQRSSSLDTKLASTESLLTI